MYKGNCSAGWNENKATERPIHRHNTDCYSFVIGELNRNNTATDAALDTAQRFVGRREAKTSTNGSRLTKTDHEDIMKAWLKILGDATIGSVQMNDALYKRTMIFSILRILATSENGSKSTSSAKYTFDVHWSLLGQWHVFVVQRNYFGFMFTTDVFINGSGDSKMTNTHVIGVRRAVTRVKYPLYNVSSSSIAVDIYRLPRS